MMNSEYYTKVAMQNLEEFCPKLLEKVGDEIYKAAADGSFSVSIPVPELCGYEADIDDLCRYLIHKGYDVSLIRDSYLNSRIKTLNILF